MDMDTTGSLDQHDLRSKSFEGQNLVGGFNPFEKYGQNGFIFPKVRGEN